MAKEGSQHMRHLSLLVAALLALPVVAQSASAPAGPGPGGGMPADMAEVMKKQMRIMEAQQKALQDPAIEKKRVSLQNDIEAAVIKIDPTLKPTLKKMHALERKMKAAADAKDMAAGQKLMAEAGPLMQKIEPAMNKVMRQPNVVTRMKAFEREVELKMVEIDPEIRKIMREMEHRRRLLQQGQMPKKKGQHGAGGGNH